VRLYQHAATQQPIGSGSYQPSARLPWVNYEEPSPEWVLSDEEMDRIAAQRRMN
jgi:hypothetical protein